MCISSIIVMLTLWLRDARTHRFDCYTMRAVCFHLGRARHVTVSQHVLVCTVEYLCAVYCV